MSNVSDGLDESFYKDFLQEGLEHLGTLEQRLLELEDADPPDPDLVGTLFRAMHSVKGGVSFIDMGNAVKLSHAAESVLAGVRDGRLPPSPAMVDALLQATDRLREMLSDPAGEPGADIDAELQRLAACEAGEDAAPPPGAPSAAEAEGTTEEAKEEEGEQTYLLRYDFAEIGKRSSQPPAAHLRDLSGLGEIESARYDDGPWQDFEADSIPDRPALAEVRLRTPLTGAHLATATMLPPACIRPAAEEEAAAPDAAPAAAPDSASEAAPDTAPASPSAPSQEAPARNAGAAPGASIRINVGLMDTIMSLAGELVLVRNQQLALLESADAKSRDNARRLDAITTQLQEAIMLTRMQPIANLFDKLPRVVRDVSRSLQKEIDLELHGREVELDKIILEGLSDPMTHIVRNACDHGIESPPERRAAGKPAAGRVTVRAFQEGGQINIEVRDDGRGIDPERIRAKALAQDLRPAAALQAMSDKELLSLILLPGFSTAETVSDISGRGVGMDVVKNCVESIGGDIELTSSPGQGSRVLLRLPLTLAIISGLVVRSGEERFVIPQAGLEELVSIKPGADPNRVELAHDQEVVRLRNRLLPVVRLGELLARPRPFDGRAKAAIAAAHAAERSAADAPARPMAVVRTSGERYGLIIDEILGTEEIVVKPLHGALRRLRCFSGCTILGDGGVAFILDVDGAGEHAGIRYTQSEAADTDVAGARALQTVDGEEIHDVILFRYGPAEQFGVPLTMVRRIEAIRTDEIQRVGDREFIVRDGVSIYVLGLDKVLQVSAPRARPPTMFLLLPKFLRRPVGFLVTEIVDTVETRILFREDSYREDGLLGSMSLQGHLTLFPDIFRATEKAEPEWLGQWRQHAPPPSHRRVLLVEDAAFFRHMVRRYLEDGGFEVETAVNGRDGLMQLSNRDFDIVISDLMMPEMDGWSFAEEVRRRARKRQMPMLALSGLQDERDQSRALQCGFDRYVAKFDREAFLGTVVELLQDAGGAGPTPPPESPGGAP